MIKTCRLLLILLVMIFISSNILTAQDNKEKAKKEVLKPQKPAETTTKDIKKETKKEFDLKFYGFVWVYAFFNDSQVVNIDAPLLVMPEDEAVGDDGEQKNGELGATARGTRLGLKIKAPDKVFGADVSGVIEFDFAGGFPDSGTPTRHPIARLRRASVFLDWTHSNGCKSQFMFGNDWMIFSPKFPPTLHLFAMANSGNLWLRTQHIGLTHAFKLGAGANFLKVQASVDRPQAGDRNDDYNQGGRNSGLLDTAGPGERTRQPFTMGRIGFNMGKMVDVGISAEYGREGYIFEHPTEMTDEFGAGTKYHGISSYAGSLDLMLNFGIVKISGEYFRGENIDQYFNLLGGIRTINDPTGTYIETIEAVRTQGGWAALTVSPPKMPIAFNLGAGTNIAEKDDVNDGSMMQQNAFFGNVVLSPVKYMQFAFEVHNIITMYKGVDKGDNLGFILSTKLIF